MYLFISFLSVICMLRLGSWSSADSDKSIDIYTQNSLPSLKTIINNLHYMHTMHNLMRANTHLKWPFTQTWRRYSPLSPLNVDLIVAILQIMLYKMSSYGRVTTVHLLHFEIIYRLLTCACSLNGDNRLDNFHHYFILYIINLLHFHNFCDFWRKNLNNLGLDCTLCFSSLVCSRCL